MKKEVERTKEEWRIRGEMEEKWNMEREEFKGRIEKIEQELEKMKIGKNGGKEKRRENERRIKESGKGEERGRIGEKD